MSTRHVGLALTLALIGGCAEGTPGPMESEELTLPVFSTPAVASAANFHAHARGSEEVPNPVDTRAQGQATFKVSRDGLSVDYKLNVANIQNVSQSHIHMAPFGANGGVVVWLYPSAPPAQLIPGRSQGVLADGTITAANLVGALAGKPLADLVDAMRAGNTYVNVHTSAFPGGEIRGQIR